MTPAIIISIVTTVATVILVGITAWYVHLTKEILKATNKPQVILYLHHNRSNISLCVENIGTGYASDITFEGSLLSFKPTTPGDVALGDMEPFKSGINYLGSGYNIKTYLFSIGQASSLPEKSFEISVYYKDSTGKDSTGTEDDNPFNFEFGNWENTSQFISPQKDDMASAIERVASNIESMENHNLGNDNAPWGSHLVIVETLKKIADALDQISKDK